MAFAARRHSRPTSRFRFPRRFPAAGTETVLYSFTGGVDGGTPDAGVVLDPSGNLYGTAQSGGSESSGVVFEITP
jgi:uncharacterized repeat protein (TIGR03803 family)